MTRLIETLRANRPAVTRWSVIAAGAILAVVLVVASLPGDDHARKHQAVHVAVMERVTGGDRGKLKTREKVVYAGIRAPRAKEPFHDECQSRNAELVEEKEVRLRYGAVEHNKKGHLLAYVFVKDQFVNEILVREGLAYVQLTARARRFAERLLLAQAEARQERLGIWSVREPTPSDTYPADPKYGNFHLPSCAEVTKIKPERLVVLESEEQAFAEGYAPCSKCRP